MLDVLTPLAYLVPYALLLIGLAALPAVVIPDGDD